MRNRKYRRIYLEHFKEIPKDSMGRSYDIHHIDGDYTNNDISNLIALSIEDHYKIHKAQSDWGAAAAILRRMKIDPKEHSDIIRNMNIERGKKGIHWSQLAVKNGTHPFLDSNFQKNIAKKSIANGTHQSHQSWLCEKCGKKGKNLANYSRYHGDNCGVNSKSKGRVWVNNGQISKMIDKEDLDSLLSQGWFSGRGSAEVTPRKTNSLGTKGRAKLYERKTTRPYNKKYKA